MSKFSSISKEKDFLALDAKRASALVQLSHLLKALENISKDRPSLRTFERIEAKIDNEVDELEIASKAVSAYFVNKGGDPMDDTDFDTYCDTATNITGQVEILRESVYDNLKAKGLLQPAAEPPSQAELLEAIKSLAESAGQQATATEKQALAALHHHKVPPMPMPIFNPSEGRNNPLVWSTFWQKFELFTVDCLDDKSRLGFLLSAVRGDAFSIIKNIKCTEANYEIAKGLLEKQYSKPETIKEQLLLSCLRFKVPKLNSDLSSFVSAIINLEVYLSELKLNHAVDILSETSGTQLLRSLVHDTMPGDILDKYQTITGKEYPTLAEFISKAQIVANRISQKTRNKLKEESSNNSQKLETSVTSTIPASISTVNSHTTQKFNGMGKRKSCMFCGGFHPSSRCPKYTTVKARVSVIKNSKGIDLCNKCLFQHGKNQKSCVECMNKDCTSKNTHSILSCPLILAQLAPKSSNSPDTKVVKVTTNKRSCSVAIPTLTAQVDLPTNDKSLQAVGILLDTAAQQSLINREVVKRLGIKPIGQEYTTLVGFGMSRPIAKSYDIVRVKLVENGYEHHSFITCLVVYRPPAICNMTGICQLAIKLSK